MFYKRKYEELLEENQRLEKSRFELIEKVEKLDRQIKGERICDEYCSKCEYGLATTNGFGYTFYNCLLDCKCEDFKQKE